MGNLDKYLRHRAAIVSILEDEAKRIIQSILYVRKTHQIANLNYSGQLFSVQHFSVTNGLTSIPAIIPAEPGIYVFVCAPTQTNSIITIPDSINSVPYAASFLKKNYYFKNNHFLPIKYGDVVYVGKTQSDLSSRLSEHIFNPVASNTYSLRLNTQYRSFLLNNVLECICFILDARLLESSNIILPFVETELQARGYPRAGRKS